MIEKEINYPAHTTFKAIFKPHDDTQDTISKILSNHELSDTSINLMESKTGKFISYTITALFPTRETLNKTCNDIANIKGCMYLF